MQKTKKSRLFNKDFTLIVIGQIISLLGNVTMRFALSMFILDKTGSAAVFGGILAVATIPAVLLSPLGGVLADHKSKKWIMVVLDTVTSLLIVGVTLFINTDVVIYVIAVGIFLFSVIHCFYQPSVQASVPLVVSEDKLMAANGTVTQVSAIANLIGPVLGGVMYAALGILPMLVICAGCYLFSAVLELFIIIPHIKQKQSENGVIEIVKQDLKIGVKFMIVENKSMLKALISIALFNFAVSSFLTVGLPVMVKMFLGLGDLYYSYAQSAMGIGSIIGAVIVSSLAKKIKPQNIYLFLIISSLSLMFIAGGVYIKRFDAVYGAYALITVGVLLSMIFSAMFLVYAQTLMQQVAPPQLLGKISAFSTAMVICAMPIGQALYGWLFDKLIDNGLCVMIIAVSLVCVAGSFISKKCFEYFNKYSVQQAKQRFADAVQAETSAVI